MMKFMKKNILIAVIGGSECTPDIEKLAYETGKEIAKQKFILICGGLKGVMEAAAKGAYEAGGITVGILPGKTKLDANPYIQIPIATDLSHARNAIITRSADAVIAINGKYGTLSEIGLALAMNKPVYGLETWDIKGIIKVKSPKEAVLSIKKLFNFL